MVKVALPKPISWSEECTCPAARADRYWPSYRSGAPQRPSVDLDRPSGAQSGGVTDQQCPLIHISSKSVGVKAIR